MLLAAYLFLATAVLHVAVAGTACGQTSIVATDADVVNYGIPAINNSGTIVFGGLTPAGESAVFMDSGGGLTSFAMSGPVFQQIHMRSPAIGDDGTIVFGGRTVDAREGIFFGPSLPDEDDHWAESGEVENLAIGGGFLTTTFVSPGNANGRLRRIEPLDDTYYTTPLAGDAGQRLVPVPPPAINNDGDAVFIRSDTTEPGVYTLVRSRLIHKADPNDPDDEGRFVGETQDLAVLPGLPVSLSLGDTGLIAVGVIGPDDTMIMTMPVTGGSLAEVSIPLLVSFDGGLSVNDAGAIAFQGEVFDPLLGFVRGIFRFEEGAVTKIVAEGDIIAEDYTLEFLESGSFGPQGFNSSGQLVFRGALRPLSGEGALIDAIMLTSGDNEPPPPPPPPPPSEFRWTNPSGGDFDEASNWDVEEVPGPDASVFLDLPGSYVVFLSENVTVDRTIVRSDVGPANVTLALEGHRLDSRQVLTDTNGNLNINGTSIGSQVTTDVVNIGTSSRLSGAAWFRPRSGGSLEFINEGELRLGLASQAAPVSTLYTRFDSGPEPERFFAHIVVRGDFAQEPTATMNVVLTGLKAVNQARDFAESTPLPSADLWVTGQVDLQGKLNVTLAAGYEPQHGDSFNIIRGDLVTPFQEANITLPVAPHNGLALVPIQSIEGVRAVVPQKVVLAWGHDAPVGLVRHDILGRTTWSVNRAASEAAFAPAAGAAASFEIYKNAVLASARQYFSAAGVEGIVFTAGEPEEGAINLYFMPSTATAMGLGGLAYTGIDRLNLKADGEALVVVHGFDPTDPLDVEVEAETVAHEIGHLLGLRHIDPPGALEIMDYDRPLGDVEEFTNGIFPITEPPRAGGTVYPDLQNPVYHLRRYVDGVPHEELVDGQTIPGTWDLPSPVLGDLQTSFAFSSTADPMDETLLYDVMVFETLAGDPSEGVRVLAEFPEISLSELADESFLVSGGEGIGMFAASEVGQTHDVALAPGDPFLAQALVLYPGWGELEGFLQVEAATPAGFETLASVMLQIVSDLLAGDYNNSGTVEQGDLDLVLLNWGTPATPAPSGWINGLPAGTIDQAELDGVLLHWGQSATTASPATAVPEPATLVIGVMLLAMSLRQKRGRNQCCSARDLRQENAYDTQKGSAGPVYSRPYSSCPYTYSSVQRTSPAAGASRSHGRTRPWPAFPAARSSTKTRSARITVCSGACAGPSCAGRTRSRARTTTTAKSGSAAGWSFSPQTSRSTSSATRR